MQLEPRRGTSNAQADAAGSALQFLLRVGPRTLLMGGAEETGQAKLLAGFPWKTHGKLSLGSEIENDFVTKI